MSATDCIHDINVIIIYGPSAVGVIFPHAAALICLLLICVVLVSFCCLPFLVNASDFFAFAPFPLAFALTLAFAFVPWRVLALVRIVWAIIAEVTV